MLTDYRVRQRDYLLEVMRAISSRLELGEVLKLILQYAVELMQGRAGIVALVEPGDAYQIRATFGLARSLPDRLQPMLAKAGSMREAASLLESNLVQLVQQAGMGQLEVVWLPLNIGADVLGNLYILRVRGGEFTVNDRMVLQSFADQAAIAVHNAQLYAELAQEKRRLNLADEMKSTFISVVSHELKTPVAIIKGYAATLNNSEGNWNAKTVREGLEIIEDEADRLTELIDNMLDASRAQGGGFKLSPVELDIDELVVKTVVKFQSQTTQHTIVADVPSDMPLVYADESRIIQVLNNLISNAIKYSPLGGEVRVHGTSTETEVIITVVDQGPGIAAEDQPHVFERFFRSKTAVTSGVPGTGLGLYLSKVFVESHHGRIWLESDGVHGSTFGFSLPRA